MSTRENRGDHATLAMLIESIQQREEHWVIADLATQEYSCPQAIETAPTLTIDAVWHSCPGEPFNG